MLRLCAACFVLVVAFSGAAQASCAVRACYDPKDCDKRNAEVLRCQAAEAPNKQAARAALHQEAQRRRAQQNDPWLNPPKLPGGGGMFGR